ncbi:hypothetical protein ABT297_17625 [Dactylosporangium sp. NPDC000555]|uniref:hypothetical protein n=1 Tax=Dactylosporangium sp. NPDC000555 TaxID=3154260 RepID=UPI00331FEED7
MPLFSQGSFDAFRAVANGPASTQFGATGERSFAALRELTRQVQPVPVTFVRSAAPVRLELAALNLPASSHGMLRRVLDPAANIHVLAWCWDLSGRAPVVLPNADSAEAKRWRLDLTDGRRSLGESLVLWSDQPVVAGLCVRVIVWEGEHARVPEEIGEAMRHSRLTAVLTGLPDPARTTITSAIMAREAAAGLGTDIAPVLRALCPDYVDLFEGFFPATSAPADAEEISHRGDDAELRVRISG